MMRNLPPKYTAGLARRSVRPRRPEPRLPARISAIVVCDCRPAGRTAFVASFHHHFDRREFYRRHRNVHGVPCFSIHRCLKAYFHTVKTGLYVRYRLGALQMFHQAGDSGVGRDPSGAVQQVSGHGALPRTHQQKSRIAMLHIVKVLSNGRFNLLHRPARCARLPSPVPLI